MTGIIDRLSWPAHQGSRPSPGLGDGLRWTGLNGGGINQKKTKSGFNFLGYKFSIELMRTEGVMSLVKGRLISVSIF